MTPLGEKVVAEPEMAALSRIAIVTPQEGNRWAKKYFEECAFTKACYAAHHGVDFILDRANYSASHHRHRTWNRVPAMRAALMTGKYDWAVYLDADVAVANYSVSPLEFTSQLGDDVFVAFTDATLGFNAGAFFLRNSPPSFDFLDRWWSIADGLNHRALGFSANDQVAAWDVVVDLAIAALPAGHPEKRPAGCRSLPLLHPQDWPRAMKCFEAEMRRLSLPFGARDAAGVAHWNYIERWPRGFTFFYPDSAAMSVWPRAELFTKGDWVIHTRKAGHMKAVGAFDEMVAAPFCRAALRDYPNVGPPAVHAAAGG